MDKFGMKTGFFIDGVGRHNDGAWHFSCNLAPNYKSFKDLTDFNDYQPPSMHEYMPKFPNMLTKVKISKQLHEAILILKSRKSM